MHARRSLIGILAVILLSLAPVEGTTQEIERGFFIDTYSGAPNCMIVVGERAAVSDIIASTWIATQVGAMAYVDEPVSILAHQDVVY